MRATVGRNNFLPIFISAVCFAGARLHHVAVNVLAVLFIDAPDKEVHDRDETTLSAARSVSVAFLLLTFSRGIINQADAIALLTGNQFLFSPM